MKPTFAKRAICLSLTVCLSACASYSRVNEYEVARLNDGELNCEQLLNEIGELKSARDESSRNADGKRATALGAQTSAFLPMLGVSFVPLAVVGLLASPIIKEGSNADNAIAVNYGQRIQHLTSLFAHKGCKAPKEAPAPAVS